MPVLLALIGFVSWFTATPCQAGPVYLELGAGESKFYNGSGLWGGNAPGSSGLILATDIAFAVDISPKKSKFRVHFGLMDRLSGGTNGLLSYQMQSIYPFFRFQFDGVFITMGGTPFVFTGAAAGWQFLGLARNTRSVALLGEVGYEHVVTPEISFGLSATAETTLGNGSLSPAPLISAIGFMRLYFGWAANFSDSATPSRDASMRNDGGYRGWRYPYGNPLY